MGYSPGNLKMLTQFSNASINRKKFFNVLNLKVHSENEIYTTLR